MQLIDTLSKFMTEDTELTMPIAHEHGKNGKEHIKYLQSIQPLQAQLQVQ